MALVMTDAFVSTSLSSASSYALFGCGQSPGTLAAGCRYSSPTSAARSCAGTKSGGLAGQQSRQTVARPGQLAVAIATLRSGDASYPAAIRAGEWAGYVAPLYYVQPD